MDGLCFSDHSAGPGLIEYKKAVEPVQVLEGSSHKRITIINRYDFLSLDHLKGEWSIVGDGLTRPRQQIEIPTGIRPGDTAELAINGISLEELPAESYLEIRFSLKDSTAWAEADHEVAFDQILVKAGPNLETLKSLHKGPRFEVASPRHNVTEIFLADGPKITIDTSITSRPWTEVYHPLVVGEVNLSFYRAVTDNDRPKDGTDWIDKRLHQVSMHEISSEIQSYNDGSWTRTTRSRIAPPVFEWSVDTTIIRTYRGNTVSIRVVGTPKGINLPRTFARIGLDFSLSPEVDRVEWFGRGPGESYSDKKLSQRFGNWSLPVDALFTNYEYPQESGNRTDVRWVKFLGMGGRSIKASFGDVPGCSFAASHYRTADIDECTHPFELHKRRTDEVQVRLDWRHHGLGTGSCGPKTLPEYELRSEPFDFEVLLESNH